MSDAAKTVSPRDEACEKYMMRALASCYEVGYGTPDTIWQDWAADAFRKGYNARDEEVKRLNDLAAKALIALERCYSDAIHFLNEGDFKRHVEWDAGYIVDAIAALKETTR